VSVDRLLCHVRDNSNDGSIRKIAKQAREDLNDVLEDLNRRNKLIKLADVSENRWATASEYETQLADNSDDDLEC
jgi:hypothetical protein